MPCTETRKIDIEGLLDGIFWLVIWEHGFYTSYTSLTIADDTVLPQSHGAAMNAKAITRQSRRQNLPFTSWTLCYRFRPLLSFAKNQTASYTVQQKTGRSRFSAVESDSIGH
jgi:hypothetical protein